MSEFLTRIPNSNVKSLSGHPHPPLPSSHAQLGKFPSSSPSAASSLFSAASLAEPNGGGSDGAASNCSKPSPGAAFGLDSRRGNTGSPDRSDDEGEVIEEEMDEVDAKDPKNKIRKKKTRTVFSRSQVMSRNKI